MSASVNTTLLIADDDPSHLLLAEAALAGAGFLVHTASDGEEAVRRFGEVQPDLVVLDVMMPKMTGIEACRAIRELAGPRPVPILMLTSRNDLPAISDAYAAGASDFAQKGMNPRLLVERVRFLLRDRAVQDELRSSRSKLLLAQSIARVGHWELTVDGRTLHVSPMLGELLGVDPQRLGRYEDFVALLDPAGCHDLRTAFVACATGNGPLSFDHRITRADGSVISVHQEAELVQGPGGPGDSVVIVTLQDLTRLHRAEEAVRQLSYFDAATGLPNRRHLSEQVAAALQDAAATAASGVVAFRVHDFARITQAHGGQLADRVLVQLARRIEAELARVSQDGTILWRVDAPAVCRTADGELAVMLRSRISADHIATVTHVVLEAVSAQAQPADTDVVPAISAGVALAEDGTDAEQLLNSAHAAAELASEPRSSALYSAQSQAQLRRRLSLESALRLAVERRELQLLYQPRVSIESFELTGVECRVRWEHAQFGKIPGEEFLALAEETGAIDEIGAWTIENACRQLAAWYERYDERFFAAVRVSGRQLHDARLVGRVQEALQRHRLEGTALQLEIAESSITAAPELARNLLQGLRSSGVRIGIDDYGTGHSSIGQIRRVPFHSMKLDRALMTDLYTDPWAQGVTAAVLAMARAMQIRAVVDGVDDAATLQMLHAVGCDEIQGQHVAPPMRAKDFEEWLERGGATRLAEQVVFEPVTPSDDDDPDATTEEVKWA